MVPKKRERSSYAPTDAPQSAPCLERASKISEEAISFEDWPQAGQVRGPKSAGTIRDLPIQSIQNPVSGSLASGPLPAYEENSTRDQSSPKFLPPLDIPAYESFGDPFASIGRVSFLDTFSKPNSLIFETPPPPVPPKSPRSRRSISPLTSKIAMIHVNGSAATLVNNSRSVTPSTPQEDRASPQPWDHSRDEKTAVEQQAAHEIPRSSPLRQSERRESKIQIARKEVPKSVRQSIRQSPQKAPSGIRNRTSATEQTIISAVLRKKSAEQPPRDLLSTYDISSLSRVSHGASHFTNPL
jgi:hypothetical protein